MQVRSLIEVLPFLDVVENDAFNSSPTDPKMMGPEALKRFTKGETLPATKARTPLVELPLGATEDRICGALLLLLLLCWESLFVTINPFRLACLEKQCGYPLPLSMIAMFPCSCHLHLACVVRCDSTISDDVTWLVVHDRLEIAMQWSEGHRPKKHKEHAGLLPQAVMRAWQWGDTSLHHRYELVGFSHKTVSLENGRGAICLPSCFSDFVFPRDPLLALQFAEQQCIFLQEPLTLKVR